MTTPAKCIRRQAQRQAIRQLEDLVDSAFGDAAALETSRRGNKINVVLKISGTPERVFELLKDAAR